MLSKSYKLICFDADGTLLDYDSSEAWALEQACKRHGLAFCNDTVERYRKINKRLWDALEQGKIEIERLKKERFIKTFPSVSEEEALSLSKTYLFYLQKAGFLIEGAEEVLKNLYGRYRLILLSNGLAATQEGRLKAAGIYHYFDSVITSESAGYAKPDKRIFDAALKGAKSKAEEALMVGDNFNADIEGAINAGMDACWYNPQNDEKDSKQIYITVKRLTELLNFLI